MRRRYKKENENIYQELFDLIRTQKSFDENHLKDAVNDFVAENSLKFGMILPVLRLAVAGNLQGPDLFKMMEVLGRERGERRLDYAITYEEEINGKKYEQKKR